MVIRFRQTRAQARLLHTIAALFKSCGCEGHSFQGWVQQGFLNSVGKAGSASGVQMVQDIEQFCIYFQSAAPDFVANVGKHLHKDCAALVSRCTDVVANTLPGVFQELVDQLLRACLDQQAWFKNSSAGFMPLSESQEFWLRASIHEVPTEKLACLTQMAKALSRNNQQHEHKDKLELCKVALQKAVLMQSLSQIQHLVLSSGMLESVVTLDTVTNCLKDLHKMFPKMMESLVSLSKHANYDVFEKTVSKSVVELLGEKFLPPLTAAVNKA